IAGGPILENLAIAGRGRSAGEPAGQTILEDLAIAARGLAEPTRRDAGGAVEGADEVGQIAEADVERDVGDRPVVLGEQAGGAPQPRADQVLLGGDAEDGGEQAEEVKLAE